MWGGASKLDTAMWYDDMLCKKYAIVWRMEWVPLLGFSVYDEPGKPLVFGTEKYVHANWLLSTYQVNRSHSATRHQGSRF